MFNTHTMFGVTHRIKRHLSKLLDGSVFPTRLFLSHGQRAAVDKCLARLVIQGKITRVTRGVFMKSTRRQKLPLPSIEEVAKVKAKAFGREIFVHGATAARRCGFYLKPRPFVFPSQGQRDEEYLAAERERYRLGLIHVGWFKPDEDYRIASIPEPNKKNQYAAEQIVCRVFAVAGKTTSFMYGKVRIVLKGMAQRYLKLGDSVPGLFLRGLLHAVNHKDIQGYLNSSPILLRREHKQILRDSRWQMPSWLSDQFFIDQWQPQALTNNCLA